MMSAGYKLLISSIYYLSLDPGAALISYNFFNPSDKTKALKYLYITFWLSYHFKDFLRINVKHITRYLMELQKSKVPRQVNKNTFVKYFLKLF